MLTMMSYERCVGHMLLLVSLVEVGFCLLLFLFVGCFEWFGPNEKAIKSNTEKNSLPKYTQTRDHHKETLQRYDMKILQRSRSLTGTHTVWTQYTSLQLPPMVRKTNNKQQQNAG